MFRQKDTLDMHVYSKNTLQKHIYVCLGSKIPWICMYIAKISHKTYILYVQVARYLGHVCIQQNTSQKYMYVQVAKYLMKKRERARKEKGGRKKNRKKNNKKNKKLSS